MPDATIEVKETMSTVLASAANTPALCGVCSKGITTQSYTFDPDGSFDAVRTALGDGELTEITVSALRYGKRRVEVFPIAPTVAGAFSSVTESVSLPNVTLSGVSAAGDILVAGPWHSLHCALKITAAGAEGVATFRYSLDYQVKNGVDVSTYSGDYTVPIAKKAVLVGTVDLSGIASISATLDGLTFIITSDTGGPSTCTFSTPADVAAVLTQINAAWSGEATVALVGASKLAIYSVTQSSAGTLTLGSGTANTALGFVSGATATGSDAKFEIPNTGIVTTWATGTFALNGLYTFDTTAPRFAAAALSGVFTRIKAKIAAGSAIGFVFPVQEDADVIAGRTMLDALLSQLTTALSEGFPLWALYGLDKDAADADVVTYCGTFTSYQSAVTVGDYRAYGGLLPGARFHRPASWIAVSKAMRDRFSSDLGNRADRALNTAFGVTEIGRDERTATTKLATFRTPQTAEGGGFLALETPANSAGEAYFYSGRTMAASGSTLGDTGPARVVLAAARQAQRSGNSFVNQDFATRPDGTLAAGEAVKDAIEADLDAVLLNDPDSDVPHVSAFSVSVPTLTSGVLAFNVGVRPRAKAKKVLIQIGIEAGPVIEET